MAIESFKNLIIFSHVVLGDRFRGDRDWEEDGVLSFHAITETVAAFSFQSIRASRP